jgi:hypothetical protein
MIDHAEIDIIETNEKKSRSLFMNSFLTILVLILSVSYGVMWGTLFLVYTHEINFDAQCLNLVQWDYALTIVQYISAGLHLISTIFQFIASSRNRESNVPKYIMGVRSCLVYVAGLVILIGISVAYSQVKDINLCGNITNLNLAYIIVEWSLFGFCFLFVCVICVASILLKKRRR